MTTFTEFLIEDKNRAYTKNVVSKIDAATDNKYDVSVSTRTGSTEPMLSIKTNDGKLPTDILNVFKQYRIGVGNKETVKNKDGSVNVKIFVMEI